MPVNVGLIFGGAYLRREICVLESIGLACSEKEIYHFCFVYFVFEGKFKVHAPPLGGGGAYIWSVDLTEGFFALRFWGGLYLAGLMHGGAYFRNFTVDQPQRRKSIPKIQ